MSFQIPGVDLDVMFANIEDICEISLKLLRSMELAAKAEFDNQLIGNDLQVLSFIFSISTPLIVLGKCTTFFSYPLCIAEDNFFFSSYV